MATYVFSDVHGHNQTLVRLLERVQPSSDDEVWVLGDMVDRGPDPVGAIRTCQEIPNVHILMGNHEDMMLDFFYNPHNPSISFQWELNGGHTTKKGLAKLSEGQLIDVVDWTANLPLGAHVNVGGRKYLLVHAGLRPLNFSARSRWTDATMDALLRYQFREDVLWIRDEFWGVPTGFIDERGVGPVVIAGHTPVPYVEDVFGHNRVLEVSDRYARNVDHECQIMRLGACEATGGIADRWAIDCGAAGGAEFKGRIGMVRLDDGMEFYESIREGE